jgi:type II secretory pathway pseudopilin PulG
MKSEKLKMKNYKTHNINNLKNLNNFNNLNKLNNFKTSFTLIEAVFVIVILAFILIGGFQILSKLYVRNYIAKQTSNFEFSSQQSLDQLAQMLYYRVPLSTIGYDPDTGDFKYIGEITTDNYKILEWIGYENDAMQEENLSGFVDLYASDKADNKIMCRDFNYGFIQGVVERKFNKPQGSDLNESAAIVFAGSFDRGEESVLDENEYNNSFGWHEKNASKVFTFNSGSSDTNNDVLLELNKKPKRIYEKYYLVDSAYAVARGADILKNVECIADLKLSDLSDNEFNNTLFLFYNYRPWLGETFCADKNGNSNNRAGNATVLAFNVYGFKVRKVNSHLVLKITLNRKKADMNITVSKQKVAF